VPTTIDAAPRIRKKAASAWMLAAADAVGRSVAGRRGRADFRLHLLAGIARSPNLARAADVAP
jgi:hypothetical protein